MTSSEIIASHIENSIARALRGESYLDPEVLKIHGFATPTMRHLFSNLCHLDDISYLECGVFCGATFVAAFNNNPIHAVGIDDFSQPFEEQGVRYQLADNLNRWKRTGKTVNVIDDDCFGDKVALMLRASDPFDIFYYDGEHGFESQAKALPTFFQVMANRFIFIVDDFQWESVYRGTESGFDELRKQMKIEKQWILKGEEGRSDDPTWHNGVAIFLISKVK